MACSTSTSRIRSCPRNVTCYLADVTGATIRDNYLDVGRSLIYGFRVTKVNISGGQLINLGACITRFSTSTDVQITSLFVDGHGAGHYFYTTCTNIHIDGGSILKGRADAFRPKHITHSGTTEWSLPVRDRRRRAHGHRAAEERQGPRRAGSRNGARAAAATGAGSG
jgi:hypothetical protein